MAALALGLLGCGSNLQHVPGSTLWVGKPEIPEGTDLDLTIFTKASQCAGLSGAEPEDCLPWVDRAAGEVRLAFQFNAGGEPWPMAIEEDHIRVAHQGSVVQEGQNRQRVELIQHNPMKTDQLFVLLIDASGSMNNPPHDPRIGRVVQALLQPDVVDAFFTAGQTSGVVLLEFSGTDVRPVGGTLKVIQDRREYKRMVRTELRAGVGYTNLYQAVEYATGTLLRDVPEVATFLQSVTGAPTVIALTDGFNNARATDTCGDNAERLQRVVGHLGRMREEAALKHRPRVFTVGLGKPFRRKFELPENLSVVDPGTLCGPRNAGARIDGDLETRGIDNASLEWIAAVGGGESFVKQKATDLGDAFRAAAARQYEWFEVRYAVDPFWLRRSFKTTLRLLSFADAEASVTLHPSGWFDPPPGQAEADGWVRRSSLVRTVALVLPLLGLLVATSFLSPAWFNARRILLGRLRPPDSRPSAPGAPAAGLRQGEARR
jgi:hypothetical protein